MIILTINGEKKKVPSLDQLTVSQYIKMSGKEDISFIDYLSIVFDISYKEAFNIKYKGLDKLINRIGELEDYTKLPVNSQLVIEDEVYNIKDLEISTVGQRFMIEVSAKNLKNEELLCYILAVAILKDCMDSEKIKEFKDKLLNLAYKEILPAAFFLAKRFSIGKRNVLNYMKMQIQLAKMKVYGLALELINLRRTSIFLRFKRFANYLIKMTMKYTSQMIDMLLRT